MHVTVKTKKSEHARKKVDEFQEKCQNNKK